MNLNKNNSNANDKALEDALQALDTANGKLKEAENQLNTLHTELQELRKALKSAGDAEPAPEPEGFRNAKLEAVVRERTYELQKLNLELTVAKKKAEEMDKLKSVFLANMSYEFRTPLVSILGYSEILLFELSNPDHVQSVKNISDAAERLNKTLSDVIALAEIERRKIEASVQKIDLREFLRNLSRKYQTLIEGSGVRFELRLGENEISLYTDPKLLKSILDNVFDNSAKFTVHGEISLAVREENINGFDYAVIDIHDTGIGIPQDKIDKIFLPFKQVSEGTNREYEGMGIGLSVAKQLIDILQGEISVTSQTGVGTIVSVKLPVLQTESELLSKISQARTAVPDSGKSGRYDRPYVLLVEDNEDSRTIFMNILKKHFITDIASDGINAIAMAEVNRYDIILMDINLGIGMDGIETFHRIRRIQGYENVPVIAVTAFGVKEDRDVFLKLGFYDYIQKPVLRNDFIDTIKKYLNQ